jgi:hypothetical protein
VYPEPEESSAEVGDFGGMTQVIDPKNLPTIFNLSDARNSELGEHPALLPGFLWVGVLVLYSDPGLGKSMLSGQVEEHLAYGRPFGPWLPERPVRCLVVDFEGDMRLAAERSLRNTPFGLLASDHGREMPADIVYATEWKSSRDGQPESFWTRLELLENRLRGAREAGRPFEYVRIDTMRFFIGSKPPGSNAYEWDAQCVGHLNKLALALDVAMVLVHHTNKGGELSGSTGIAGSAQVVAQLKRNADNDDECLLVSHKVRHDAPFRFALAMDERGRWEFTEDITPTQAELVGMKRKIVDLLTKLGPLELSDLRDRLPGVSANTVKSALRRLSSEQIARYYRGAWTLTAQTLAEHPKCRACSEPMEAYAPGQTTHPTCSDTPFLDQTVEKFLGTPVIPGQQAAEQQPAPAPDDADTDVQEQQDAEHPEAQRFPSYAKLKEGIDRSRMKPIKVIKKIERESGPWPLINSKMDGSFNTKRDCRPVPEGTTHVAIFDRNGSFPSAMSSVPVAPNALVHTGPLGPLERAERAGLFRVLVADWDEDKHKMPHPLGRALHTRLEDGSVWITGPHMEYLDKLAAQGRMKVSTCLESWSGRRVTNLFEPFSVWARTVRQETARADAETQAAAKNSIVVAIRSLHLMDPKKRSPFWRPDWHKAILAEASVRHWITADKAVQGGAALISIGATDEVTFAVPADVDPQLWVPEPYRLGAGFGQVKRKEIKVDGEMHATPVPVELWERRRG